MVSLSYFLLLYVNQIHIIYTYIMFILYIMLFALLVPLSSTFKGY